jgi:hypothetical protein
MDLLLLRLGQLQLSDRRHFDNAVLVAAACCIRFAIAL